MHGSAWFTAETLVQQTRSSDEVTAFTAFDLLHSFASVFMIGSFRSSSDTAKEAVTTGRLALLRVATPCQAVLLVELQLQIGQWSVPRGYISIALQ